MVLLDVIHPFQKLSNKTENEQKTNIARWEIYIRKPAKNGDALIEYDLLSG